MDDCYNLVVSLGGNCAVASQMKYRGLRRYSLPLDYVYMNDERPLKYLNEAFENNFKNFCLKENLKELQGNERGGDCHGCVPYEDEYSGYRLIHQFHRSVAEDGGYEETREVLDRRFHRLFEKINQSKKILFILTTFFPFDVGYATDLKKTLSRKYKSKKIDLLVVQFGCKEDKKTTVEKGVELVQYARAISSADFNDKSVKEWEFFDHLKIEENRGLCNDLLYGVWKRLNKKKYVSSFVYRLHKHISKKLLEEGGIESFTPPPNNSSISFVIIFLIKICLMDGKGVWPFPSLSLPVFPHDKIFCGRAGFLCNFFLYARPGFKFIRIYYYTTQTRSTVTPILCRQFNAKLFRYSVICNTIGFMIVPFIGTDGNLAAIRIFRVFTL